jgi:hypothetical protein
MPRASRLAHGIDGRIRLASRLHRLRTTGPFRRPQTGLTGRNLARIDGRTIRFAIDARDSSPIHDPRPVWPQCLVAGVSFVDAGVRGPEDGSAAHAAEYEKIPR